MRARLFLASVLVVAGVACNPYENQQGEFNAGPVDPATFPLAYLGTGASATFGPHGRVAGMGRFTESGAWVEGTRVGYYSFPFTANQTASTADPLRLLDDGRAYTPVPVPNAYVFDSAPPRAFPASQACRPPPHYVYDRVRDDMRFDEQSNIFTQLPLASEVPGVASTFTYVPIVAEVQVSAAGRACQSLKSEKTLTKVLGTPARSGNYLLWPIIDPTSPVYRVGENPSISFGQPGYVSGTSVQKYGWFGHYYLAYLDGGYIPTGTDMVTEQGRMKPVLRMRTQRIFTPRSTVVLAVSCAGASCPAGQVCVSSACRACTATGAAACPTGYTCTMGSCQGTGIRGDGYDVLEYKRGDANYSPVCEAFTYVTATQSTATLPKTVGQVMAPVSPARVQCGTTLCTVGQVCAMSAPGMFTCQTCTMTGAQACPAGQECRGGACFFALQPATTRFVYCPQVEPAVMP